MKFAIILNFWLCLIKAVYGDRIPLGIMPADYDFPYLASLEIDCNAYIKHCSGVLISDRWVLTTAQCLMDMESAVVTLGSGNLNDFSEDDRISYYVTEENTILHENFIFQKMENRIVYSSNDIALIQLPETVIFTESIQPVGLPELDSYYSKYTGQMAVISVEATLEGDNDFDLEPDRILMPVIPNRECKLGSYNLDQSHICTLLTGGQSICQAYQGAPLVLDDEPKTLIGILSSYDFEICDQDGPVVFTRLTTHLDWISYHTEIFD